jgi:cell pole-organizing protein PopZ
MEEILASIRRIIESNEPAGEGGSDHAMRSPYADDELIDDIEDENFASDLSAGMAANDPGSPLRPHLQNQMPFQSEPYSPPANEAPKPVSAQTSEPETASSGERSLSLADVAARVRAASARQQETAMSRPAPRMSMPSAPMPAFADVALRDTIAPVETRPAATVSKPIETPMVKEVEPAGPSPIPALKPQPAVAQQPELSEPAEPPAPKAQPQQGNLPAMIEEAAATLLSEEAGAQVTKSFNELAAVFDGLERRSVEDIAQEMLRPMLQEWLDDNLPTLVERLVREEIERVARGPRR